MPHDWGVTVPEELPTETVIEVRDKLRAGTLTIDLPDGLRSHEKFAEWQAELNTQTLAAYEKEAARRIC